MERTRSGSRRDNERATSTRIRRAFAIRPRVLQRPVRAWSSRGSPWAPSPVVHDKQSRWGLVPADGVHGGLPTQQTLSCIRNGSGHHSRCTGGTQHNPKAWRTRWIKSTATAPTTPTWARPTRRMCRRRRPVECPKRPNRSGRRPHRRRRPHRPDRPRPCWQTAPPGAETNEAVPAYGSRSEPTARPVASAPQPEPALVGVEHRGADRVECNRSGRRRYRDEGEAQRRHPLRARRWDRRRARRRADRGWHRRRDRQQRFEAAGRRTRSAQPPRSPPRPASAARPAGRHPQHSRRGPSRRRAHRRR